MTKPRAPLPALPAESFIVDTHCHLDMDEYQADLDALINRAATNGVAGIVTIGIDLQSSKAAVAIAANRRCVRATIGIHPHHAEMATTHCLEEIGDLAERYRNEVVGYGEIGLDYTKRYAEPTVQKTAFVTQLGLARELGLPVIIHDREAHDECLKIIRAEGPFNQSGIMHCFSGDLEFARKIIDCNFYISIPGIVTFKNARQLQKITQEIPADRLLMETDGPFLAPVPYRGTRNEPLYILYTAAAAAELRQTSLQDIAEQTSRNACTVFRYQFNEAVSTT